MLTYQDITGVYREMRKLKKINLNNLTSDKTNKTNKTNSNSTMNNNINSNETDNKIKKFNDELNKKKIKLSKSQGDIYISGRNNNYKLEKKKKMEQDLITYQEKLKNIHKLILKPKTVSKNEL